MANSAKYSVLQNPVLVEAILLCTSNWTILHAQRVSRAWRLIIQSSIPLQQELFLRPGPPTIDDDGSQIWRFNPLLFVTFHSWFTQPRSRYNMPSIKAFEDMEWGKTEASRTAFTRAEASWRRMLPIQPAIEVLEIKNFSHGKMIDGLSNDVAYFRDGLRMGVLYDLTEGHIARHRVSSFTVIWPSNCLNFSVGYLEQEATRQKRGENRRESNEPTETKGRGKDSVDDSSPPPPPSPPRRPQPIKTRAEDGSYLPSAPPSAALPSPWVIGSLVSTRITNEDEPEHDGTENESDFYDETNDTDSLCGEPNYDKHATLILAHVEQCMPGSFPTRRLYKSEGQEPVAIQVGRHRYRKHGGHWEDLQIVSSYLTIKGQRQSI